MSDQFVYSPPQGPIVVVYRDKDIIVVDKPAGLLCMPGRLHKDSMMSRLQERVGVVYDVHRLDMDTSGIMLFALRRKAEKVLKAAFRERKVQKSYVALVEGQPPTSEGEIDLPLRRQSGLPPRSFVDFSEGKKANTAYRVLEHRGDQTLLELIPKTGRSHQLRVHMLACNTPIVGDRIYNSTSAASRLMLHAEKLAFQHPYSGQRLELKVECPFRSL